MLSQKNIMIHALSLGVLWVSFGLCRYAFLEYHGMTSWSELLYFVGKIAIATSFCLKGKIAPICTAFAYSIGFVAGIIFQTNGVDPGGGTTNNLWIIWTAVFAGLIVVGIIVEIVIRTKNAPRKETI